MGAVAWKQTHRRDSQNWKNAGGAGLDPTQPLHETRDLAPGPERTAKEALEAPQ